MEKTPIVIQIVNNYLELATPNGLQKFLAYFIALLWNYFKSRLDGKRVIQIHQGSTCISAHRCFHVMCHHGATRSAFRPEPDKRDPIYLLRFQAQEQNSLQNLIHTPIDRPAWEEQLVPSP